jgi:DNA-binding Xre family transcriptional regulator
MDHDAGPPDGEDVPGLPLLPGFREMALRRMSARRRRLVAELIAQRRSAGLSQTEVAARMGTSQSAVARLETGEADVRVSTLERYAAAIGSQLAWQAQAGQAERDQPELSQPSPGQPGPGQPGPVQPGQIQPGPGQPGQIRPGPGQPGQIRPGPGQPGQIQLGPEQRGQL